MNNICVQYCKILGVATSYGLDGPGFVPRWGGGFRDSSGPAPRLTQPPVQRVPLSFPGAKCSRRGGDYPLPFSANSSSNYACLACNGIAFTLYVYLFVVSAGLRPLILHSSRHFCHFFWQSLNVERVAWIIMLIFYNMNLWILKAGVPRSDLRFIWFFGGLK
jgi:hypothetical protein